MPKNKKSIPSKIFLLVNILVITAYLIACLVPYINNGEHWVLAIPGLLFPYLFFTLLLIILIRAITKSKWWWVSLIALLLGMQQITAVFGFHLFSSSSNVKAPNELRVLNWNVSLWDAGNWTITDGHTYQPLMFDLLRMQNADVLCFQEYFECLEPSIMPPNIPIITKMGYPYHYFTPVTFNVGGKFQSGLCIFSKYPIIDSAFYKLETAGSCEGLSVTDIRVNNKTFRIFTTHLESNSIERRDYNKIYSLQGMRTIFRKIRNSYFNRNQQAQFIAQKIKESPHPAILCGDFNAVPNTSAYFNIKGNLKDAFLEKGFFLGVTRRSILQTLRIDYILTAKDIETTQFNILDVPYSYHYPLIADFKY